MENTQYTRIYRITHWAIAFCMLFLLFTIFLRKTWLNKDHIAWIIQNFIATTDVTLTEEQTFQLAKQIRKPMWDWHIYAGYVLTVLYTIRLTLSFWGKMKFPNPFVAGLPFKEQFRWWVYVLFYLCTGISLITGLALKFGPDRWEELMENIHILSIYYLIGFIFLHFGGILLAEMKDQKGIISKMIGGK